MEEKIYDRQVIKETLSHRVIDEQQINRHFTAADLSQLYAFNPDQMDNSGSDDRPMLPIPKVIIQSAGLCVWSLFSSYLSIIFTLMNFSKRTWLD